VVIVPSPLCLEFEADVPAHVRSRISYAFRVFAAIYNHVVVDAGSSDPAIHCFYGRTPPQNSYAGLLHLPALYRDMPLEGGPPPLTKYRYAGEDFYLTFGIDPASGRPDWLAEIFQWLSSSYELGIVRRDSVGRIPYSETVFSRQGISPLKPHATLLMAWLENIVLPGKTNEALPKAPSPVPGIKHIVVCTHDIDFYFVDRISTMLRLTKNLVISVSLYRSWSYFSDNLRMMFRLFTGKRAGDYLASLMETSTKYSFQSTFFVVSRRRHRRDPSYRLEQIVPWLREASKNGFSIGLHGSYRSTIEDRSLEEEAHCLSERLGQKVLGNRQHWLRFGRYEELFAGVAKAGLIADSSLGFPDMVGFRNGASFAFPPYDFEREAPYSFLEIPLVLMDGSLEAASRQLRAPPHCLAEEILEESRKQSWGGIAVLWHNPLEALSVPAEINHVFWSCVNRRVQFREKWMSLDQFLAAAVQRYQQAGLLQGVRIDDAT